MCTQRSMIGNVLIALGAGLLVSLLIPRCFWTALVGVVLVLLGLLLTNKTC